MPAWIPLSLCTVPAGLEGHRHVIVWSLKGERKPKPASAAMAIQLGRDHPDALAVACNQRPVTPDYGGALAGQGRPLVFAVTIFTSALPVLAWSWLTPPLSHCCSSPHSWAVRNCRRWWCSPGRVLADFAGEHEDHGVSSPSVLVQRPSSSCFEATAPSSGIPNTCGVVSGLGCDAATKPDHTTFPEIKSK